MKRLDTMKAERDADAVRGALAGVCAAARQADANLMPSILEAVRVYATAGEVVDALASVFGRWTEDPVI